MNIDFEALPTGTVPYTSTGWTVCEGTNANGNTIMCPSSTFTFAQLANQGNAEIKATPLNDPVCGTVPHSPLGGSHIILLNQNNYGNPKMTRIAKQISVTSSNWFFKYAYIGVIHTSPHPCCEDVNIQFNFYDCMANPITSACYTISSPSGSCSLPFPSCVLGNSDLWIANSSTPAISYNSGWSVKGVNLSQYIGSCVTIEVLVSNCAQSAHHAHLYYDAMCGSSGGIAINNQFVTGVGTTTVCTNVATVTAIPCFNSYLWQGPATSTVTGLTTSSITTSLAGIYTVTAGSGPVSSTQTISIAFSPVIPSVSIITNTLSGCFGSSFNLQLLGNSLVSYTWSNGSNLSAISVTLFATTVYSVIATDPAGCTATDSKTVTIFPKPTTSISVVASSCNSHTLSAAGSGFITYNWSNSSSTPTAQVTTTMNTVYSVSVTNSNGCIGVASKSIQVLSLPVINITPISPTICPYQKITLYGFGNGLVSYNWSTGSTLQTTSVYPLSTTIYSFQGTDSAGCTNTKTIQVTIVYCVGITENNELNKDIRIYPNPNNGSFVILATAETEGAVYDEKGALIMKFKLTADNDFKTECHTLNKGTYMVRCNGGAEKIIVR